MTVPSETLIRVFVAPGDDFDLTTPSPRVVCLFAREAAFPYRRRVVRLADVVYWEYQGGDDGRVSIVTPTARVVVTQGKVGEYEEPPCEALDDALYAAFVPAY